MKNQTTMKVFYLTQIFLSYRNDEIDERSYDKLQLIDNMKGVEGLAGYINDIIDSMGKAYILPTEMYDYCLRAFIGHEIKNTMVLYKIPARNKDKIKQRLVDKGLDESDIDDWFNYYAS